MPRRKGGSISVRFDYGKLKDVLVPYRRVSTREQADKGAGLQAQFTGVGLGLQMRGATALNWDCVDKGKSGKNLQRNGLEAALKHVHAGQAGGIIVSKLDRLSRSLLDFAYLMAKADREGWNIVALDLGVDLRTPAGKAMAGMLAVFAEFERNVIRERTKDGLAEKKAEGVRLGRPRSIDLDLLMGVIAAYHGEGSYNATAKLLNEALVPTINGGKQWYPAVVQKLVLSQDGRAIMEQFEEAA